LEQEVKAIRLILCLGIPGLTGARANADNGETGLGDRAQPAKGELAKAVDAVEVKKERRLIMRTPIACACVNFTTNFGFSQCQTHATNG
jgi:hypothetical protein